ncbi:MAG: F0F1 ATP synthase subunit A [Bacteroidaceae bacterium]|nr:F0F1 ATP synthase subunit A [Bacteroidaceae bacterium]
MIHSKWNILLALLTFSLSVNAAQKKEDLHVSEIIFGHLGDAYEWHIAGQVALPLPCILYSREQGLDIFMSDKLEHGTTYCGYHIDAKSGKIVNKAGVRPFDISITKNVLELLIVCIILCAVVLGLARWYKRNGYKKAPGGFVGMMEAVIGFIDQDVSKANIGHGYERFTPYLATVFLFILTCNLLGLIPVWPGGANLTGNIAVTMTLAIASWIAINFFAPKAYFKSIFWPDVPVFLKAPLPIMPAIEFIGVFTKPFSLTVRLFANIFAGHTIILALTCIIFVTWQTSALVGAPMTMVSVLFCIFMNCLELLVAFVQAYVFTLLTASFIGLAHNE